MHVTVRLSAGLAQVTGSPRVQVSVPENGTVADLLQQLAATYPALGPRLKASVASVGGSVVGAEAVLASGQEVALLLPVAGG